MHKRRLLTRLVSGAAVVAVTAGSALLVSSGVASANPPAGTLGFSTVAPDPGTNLSPMSSTTSAGCPTTSTKADLQVVGPIGVDPAQQVFPASNPYTAVTITDTQFSSAGPFTQQWRATFQDAVAERRGQGAPVPTGEYDFTTTCLDRLGFNTFGTFVGGLNFDTPTHYTGLPGASPTPTATPTATPTRAAQHRPRRRRQHRPRRRRQHRPRRRRQHRPRRRRQHRPRRRRQHRPRRRRQHRRQRRRQHRRQRRPRRRRQRRPRRRRQHRPRRRRQHRPRRLRPHLGRSPRIPRWR